MIHGLVHNTTVLCDNSNRRKDTILDNTMGLTGLKAPTNQPTNKRYNGFELGAAHASATASVQAFARGGKSVTSLTPANCLLQQASSTKISVVC